MRIRAAAVAAMIAGGVWGGGGCAVPKDVAPEEETPVIEVRWTGDPIQVDGVLDEAAWTEAPVVSLRHLRWNDLTQPAAARASGEKDVFERGTVRFLYDDRYFYIGFELEDADVVARGRKNGLRHFEYGDVVEIFLRYENGPGYWEFHVTPRGMTSSYFFAGSGYLGLVNPSRPFPGYEAVARIDGTPDDCRDSDHGWSAEMRIPRAELEKAFGHVFAPGEAWRLLAGRYNYHYRNRFVQHSSYPFLPKTHFHLIEYHAPVSFR